MHSEEHEWNIVRINGNWYHVDSTWNDNEANNGIQSGNRYYSWLNVPDKLVKDSDHQIINISGFSIPTCSSLQDNYACSEGAFCSKGILDPALLLFNESENAYRSGKSSIIVLFEDPSIIVTWDRIQDRFYRTYEGYDWLLYPPDEKNCQCAFVVRASP